MQVKIYEVGGCVRDEILGLPTKDIDFVAEAPSYEALRDYLVDQGFKIHVEKPEFVTIRCGVPKGHLLYGRTKDADFVLARKDGTYSDGRRPDFVEPGTLMDDLARRDFTVNAIAKNPETGGYVDPFGGQKDLKTKRLRFVGNPEDRIREDGLRVMRGLRFALTKGLCIADPTWEALTSDLAHVMLSKVAVERIREELEKMLIFDSEDTVRLLLRTNLQSAIFRDGLRLSATLKG